MSFAKPKAVQGAGLDDYQKLQCTHPGCGARWSVMIDKPKCSRHQWGAPDTAKPIPFSNMPPTDGKDWARRILKLSEEGFEIRPISLKFAKQALGIFGMSQ
jgi:hypothetical protein